MRLSATMKGRIKRVWKYARLFILAFGVSLFVPVALKEILVGGAHLGTGDSMSHGRERMSGISDDGDLAQEVPVRARSDVRTFLEAWNTSHQVAGDYGDVIVFWAYGVQLMTDGSIVTDPATDTPSFAIANPQSPRHRAIAWVEYNETSGNFDAPDPGLFNVTEFTVPNVGYYDPLEDAYLRSDLLVRLVAKSLDNRTFYPIGRHSGFITKGDRDVLYDQHLSPERRDESNRSRAFISDIVKLDWVRFKVASVVDRETVEALDAAALLAFVGGQSVAAVIAYRIYRRQRAAD